MQNKCKDESHTCTYTYARTLGFYVFTAGDADSAAQNLLVATSQIDLELYILDMK